MQFNATHRRWLGVLLLGVVIVINPWTVGYLLTEDGEIGQLRVIAIIALFDWSCLLGGLHLLFRWVDRVAWVDTVSDLHAAVVVVCVALAISGSYWGIAAFNRGHQHTVVIPAEIENATAAQRQWAEAFYNRSLEAALKHGWFDLDTALEQGFQPDRVNRTHYPNLDYMFDDVMLDPERPEWLVYHDSPDGKVLMALMFFTRELEEVGPTPAGPLAQWHYHPYRDIRCAVKGLWTVAKADKDGKCAEGIPVTRTPEMFHVWFIDHPLGRFTEMKIVPEYWQDEGFDIRLWHPILVHFAIALFVISVLLDLAGRLTGRREYHRAAWFNLVLGALASIVTVGLGMTAEVYSSPTAAAHATLDLHKLLAFGSLALILLLLAWRYALRGEFPTRGALLYLVLGITGMSTIGAAAYYGGEMVYKHGTAVRGIDQFSRDRYWKLVSDVYRDPERSGFAPATAVQ